MGPLRRGSEDGEPAPKTGHPGRGKSSSHSDANRIPCDGLPDRVLWTEEDRLRDCARGELYVVCRSWDGCRVAEVGEQPELVKLLEDGSTSGPEGERR